MISHNHITEYFNNNQYEKVLNLGLIWLDQNKNSTFSFSLNKKYTRYEILELVIIAAYKLANISVIKDSYNELETQLPNSLRVLSLKGLLYESEKNYELALKHYSSILILNPLNLVTRRRLIQLLLSSGHKANAIQLLVKHLKEFHSDINSWKLLADIYLSESCFHEALYCFEEVFMMDTSNLESILNYAETFYTMKLYDDAFNYFHLVLNRSINNTRALWGVLMTCYSYKLHHKHSSKSLKSQKDQCHRELLMKKSRDACAIMLSRLYQQQLCSKQLSENSQLWIHSCLQFIKNISEP